MHSKILRSLFVLALVFVLQGCLSGKKNNANHRAKDW